MFTLSILCNEKRISFQLERIFLNILACGTLSRYLPNAASFREFFKTNFYVEVKQNEQTIQILELKGLGTWDPLPIPICYLTECGVHKMLFYSLLNTITVELAASMSFSFCIMKSFCFIKKVPSCSSKKRWGRRIKWILDFASILVYNFAAVDVTNDDESLLLVT